ncbi:hypothetical protein [Paenibacillus eucommiae]|uniref:Uncharacterized protein n=1 Tax=Paenibacillus eucommiae TaxID=1355755 RepID=A0ABS4J880_9BACL|nr:hypothetical protein [Paenibacillus eucommiae]MBP1996015.1 hypothetical protein [Paenibacillus eucommiae]
MIIKKKRLIGKMALLLLAVYFLFFPSPTPELAVRKYIFFSLHPVVAFSSDVQEGSIKNDPRYGKLFYVDGLSSSYIYVKKNGLGWRVTSSGTGP